MESDRIFDFHSDGDDDEDIISMLTVVRMT